MFHLFGKYKISCGLESLFLSWCCRKNSQKHYLIIYMFSSFEYVHKIIDIFTMFFVLEF